MLASYPDLRGKVVFITGGGNGIGGAMTRAFAEQGSLVAFVDIAEDASTRLADQVHRETGAKPLYLPCDQPARSLSISPAISATSLLYRRPSRKPRRALATSPFW